jgi:hypothetical protein
MAARPKKSKKHFVANRQPDSVVFFLDRNIGKHTVAQALRREGIAVEVHDDHLREDAPDEEWIKLVGQKGWVAITRDNQIRHRKNQIAAVKRHRARLIVVRIKNFDGPMAAHLLISRAGSIDTFARKTAPPFVARISMTGQVSKYDI